MWRLVFPWFFLKLIAVNVWTLIQASLFRLTDNKIVTANILLTAVGMILVLFLWKLPSPTTPLGLSSKIDLSKNEEFETTTLTIEAKELKQTLLEYEQAVREKNFIPQADYVNLALLAQLAGEAEKASQYLKLAKSIDPNQGFFRD